MRSTGDTRGKTLVIWLFLALLLDLPGATLLAKIAIHRPPVAGTGPLVPVEYSVVRLREMVDRLDRHNDLTLVEPLKAAAGIEAVAILEERLAQGYAPVDEKRLVVLCQNVGSASAKVRKLAEDELAGMGPPAGPAIWRASKAQRDAGAAAVADALANAARRAEDRSGRMNLAMILGHQYQQHFDQLFTLHWPAFVKNFTDEAAQRWLCHVPFDRLWAKIADQPAQQRLRLLLLLCRSAKWDDAMAKQLAAFSAKEVLDEAAATWWPVETEPLQLDGAYGWTTRAGKVEGNVATDLLRLSVKMPDYGNVDERGQWVHINHWDRWHYILRFEQVLSSKDALVVSERVIHRDALPYHGGRLQDVQVRCETVRGVPESVAVPTVAMSGPESLSWHTGGVFEWARPYIPQQFHERLKFKPDRYAVPQVTLPAQAGSNAPVPQ